MRRKSLQSYRFTEHGSEMGEEATAITLRGSTDIVVEFFDYCVNSILYQRAIYPPESFKRVSKYGLAMMMANEEGLVAYIQNITRNHGCSMEQCRNGIGNKRSRDRGYT